MDNFILLTLKEAKGSDKIVSVHSDPSNQSSFSVGFVDAITDTHIRLRSISPYGEDMGYEIRPLNKVFRVDIDGIYEKKIDFLRKKRGKVFGQVRLDSPIETDDIIFATLQQARQHNLIVILWTEDEDDSVIGYVDSISPESVRILSIDDYGGDDGYIMIALDKITDVDCNSEKCQVIKFLNKNFTP